MSSLAYEGSRPDAARPRMPLVVLWFYLVTCVAAALFGLVQPTLAIDPVIIQLNQFGPAVGVLAVLLAWRRWRPPLATGFGLSRQVLIRLVVVVVLAGVIFAVFVGITGLAGVSRHGIRPGQLPYPFWLILAAQLIGACGEEFGWRCFLQPYVRARCGVVSSGALVGLLWGAWHVQVFSRGLVFAAGFLAMAVALSIMLAVLQEQSRHGVLIIAGGFHMLVNIGMLLLTGDSNGDAVQLSLTAACVLTACGVLLAAARRGIALTGVGGGDRA
ncbi:CAAX protease self-immunity [Micromonospora viridifaciens]|uniref:CAAX protease self-immunity n=2 Tax=Micromonospora viridifaciens TaxID=1881 RepID=A0A1C4YDN1_MICVI|nr:CAAX protease self-immunity [Micromonospora viridifaciens]